MSAMDMNRAKHTPLQRGFTLIELMIVVTIIAILSAVALPAYQDYITRAQASEALLVMSGLKTDVQSHWLIGGDLNGANSGTNGIPVATAFQGRYLAEASVASGVITGTFKAADVAEPLQGRTVVLSPITGAGSLGWSCKPGTAQARYLPSNCRP
jgi:type IV pilus assembly protein PilA